MDRDDPYGFRSRFVASDAEEIALSLRVSLEKIAHSYGKQELFGGLSFSAGAGDIVAVTGPNGSGKSTLCKIIAGLLTPRGGSVSYECDRGLDFSGTRDTGFCSPELRWYGTLSARENIALVLKTRDAIGDGMVLAERCGLMSCLDQPVSSFSSGMMQRLSLCAAFACDPALLVLDEPANHLDKNGNNFLSEMIAIHREAVIFISGHSAGDIPNVTERITLG
jgi:heme exporter protein A